MILRRNNGIKLDSLGLHIPGVSSLGVPGGAMLADQITLSQPGGTDYAYLITTGTPGFSELPTALIWNVLRRNRLSISDGPWCVFAQFGR